MDGDHAYLAIGPVFQRPALAGPAAVCPSGPATGLCVRQAHLTPPCHGQPDQVLVPAQVDCLFGPQGRVVQAAEEGGEALCARALAGDGCEELPRLVAVDDDSGVYCPQCPGLGPRVLGLVHLIFFSGLDGTTPIPQAYSMALPSTVRLRGPDHPPDRPSGCCCAQASEQSVPGRPAGRCRRGSTR
jgi:hypothetical protein